MTVIPCCFLTDSELILGDRREQSLVEILAGEACQSLIDRHEKGDLKGLPCEKCDQRYVPKKSPLLYSTDENFNINTTSGTKINLL